MQRRLLVILVALLGMAGSPPAAGQSPLPPTVVYLVRHAERADDDPDDPTLTPAGVARAELLARMLRDSSIAHVHTTPFRRTRLTAAPLATELGLAVETYDQAGQPALAERIRRTGGRHLVVGHSNTLGPLIALLGGDPGTPIADLEFDRFYLLSIASDGSVATSLRRYGAPWVPDHRASAPSLRPPSRPLIFPPRWSSPR